MKTKLAKLARTWRAQARARDKEAQMIWKKLAKGKLPQDDEIIYSVYQKTSEAETLLECSEQLMRAIE